MNKKYALVTGACINTGVAIVEKFLSEGVGVVFTGRNAEKVAAAEKSKEKKPANPNGNIFVRAGKAIKKFCKDLKGEIKKSNITYIDAVCRQNEIVKFFRSQWYSTLCDIDPQRILDKLGVRA